MKIVAPILLFFISVCGFAQDWSSTYTEALAQANSENKPILLVFSGSDWCAPCRRIDKEIWQSNEFKTFAQKNVILYNADFPRKKKNKLPQNLEKQNQTLAASFNSKGHFPLVVLLNNEEQVLGQMAYKKIPPSDYITQLKSFLN